MPLNFGSIAQAATGVVEQQMSGPRGTFSSAQAGTVTILPRNPRFFQNITAVESAAVPGSSSNAIVTMDPLEVFATFEELSSDELEITEHPVQQGSMITDHAFKRPAEITLKMGWSNTPYKTAAPANLQSNLTQNFLERTIRSMVASNIPVPAVVTALLARMNSASNGQQWKLQSQITGADPEQIKRVYEKLLMIQEARALFDLSTPKRLYQNMVLKSLHVQTDVKSENALMVTAVCRQIFLVNTETTVLNNENLKSKQKNAAGTNQGKKNLNGPL